MHSVEEEGVVKLRGNALVKRVLFCVLLLGGISGGLPLFSEGLAGERASPLEERILELEALIHELQDANNMLLENLAGCTEENAILRSELEERCPARGGKDSRASGRASGEDERKGKDRPQ